MEPRKYPKNKENVSNFKNSNFNNATQLEQETISLFRISLLNLAFYLLGPTRVTFQTLF